jgi:hypothetical protein
MRGLSALFNNFNTKDASYPVKSAYRDFKDARGHVFMDYLELGTGYMLPVFSVLATMNAASHGFSRESVSFAFGVGLPSVSVAILSIPLSLKHIRESKKVLLARRRALEKEIVRDRGRVVLGSNDTLQFEKYQP